MRYGGYAFHVQAHFIVETIPTIFYAPRDSGGAMRQRGEIPPRAALLLYGLLSACGIQPQTFFPFGVLCAPLYGLSCSLRSNRRREHSLTAPWRLWAFS